MFHLLFVEEELLKGMFGSIRLGKRKLENITLLRG
jgi:hypothetical protein